MQVTIKCKGHTNIFLDELTPFQGGLKVLTKENYERLKNQILTLGFSEAISIWQNDGKNYILNGHQRVAVLNTLKDEGYAIPSLPVNVVEADNYLQAKEKVLSLTSSYGEITEEGLYEFMSENEITPEDLDSLNFPDLDIDKFKESFFTDFQPTSGEEQGKLDQLLMTFLKCPHCGEKFERRQAEIMD